MDLKYRIIDMSKHHSEEEVFLVNKCYDTWFEIFNKDLESRGAQLNKDEFQRSRVLAVLLDGEQPVGFHLYGVFDLREKASLNHAYFRSLPESAKDGMYKRGTSSLLSMEYLTVLERYRTQEVHGARFGEIISRLGLKVMEYLGVDAALGVGRMDRKVNSLAEHFGAEVLCLLEKYNNKCCLLYFDRRQHRLEGNPMLLKFVDSLWSERQENSLKLNKVAA